MAALTMRSPVQSKSARQCNRAPCATAEPSSLWHAALGMPSVHTSGGAVRPEVSRRDAEHSGILADEDVSGFGSDVTGG